MSRPQPPAELLDHLAAPTFVPAPDLRDWMFATFIADGGALANPDHRHLEAAEIACLWTNVPATRQGRTILGQAEFKPPGGGHLGKWARARAERQLVSWFHMKPDFLLTFAADFAADASDEQFCALVEHELYHCGQAKDDFGEPKFSKETGLPIFTMRGHDIEEFAGVVKRYGAVMPDVVAFLDAAKARPVVSKLSIRNACGTCLKMAA